MDASRSPVILATSLSKRRSTLAFDRFDETIGVRGWSWRDVAAIGESLMDTDEFARRLGEALQHLRGVLIARHGLEVGIDIHAEVVSYAWENRERVAALVNPGGYLYRVSQSRARRYRRWRRVSDLPDEHPHEATSFDTNGELGEALARLKPDERTVAVVVHAYGYTYSEAAELLGMTTSAVRNRLHRGMAKLRRALEGDER
jgi:RNA polymerase sigma factor (sigma-70 family)